MTILIAFHQSGYRTFKHFYLKHVCVYWRSEFPNLVSYSRFVQLKRNVLEISSGYLSANLGTCSGLSFVDSTRLRVCENKRISSHRVFADVAERSKTSMGWFYGFKLHLIINDSGELLDVALTPGNTDDRKPLGGSPRDTFTEASTQTEGIFLKTFGRNSASKASTWFTKSVRTWTPLDLSVSDEVLLKKRMLIESVIGVMKTQTQLEHSRHRSFENFQVNVFSALIAYQLMENKPALNFSELQEISDFTPAFLMNKLFSNSR